MPRLFRHAPVRKKAKLVPASVLYRRRYAAARAGAAVRRRWRREVCGAAGDGPTAMEKERGGVGLGRAGGPGGQGQLGPAGAQTSNMAGPDPIAILSDTKYPKKNRCKDGKIRFKSLYPSVLLV